MKYLYVANWKMNMSFAESINFCSRNYDALQQLTTNASIVLCPSFLAIAALSDILKNSAVAVGAQNCSEYPSGAYTGEISAQSLAEIAVKYCIVGHSERRIYYNETPEIIMQKVTRLSENKIQPIICIGETEEHFKNKQAFVVLTQQLEPIITTLPKGTHIIVAYEPVWSIGTGIIPEPEYLHEIFTWLAQLLRMQLPESTFQLLYGGSVNAKNIHQLKNVATIDGFLIGGASTVFEEFSKIIVQR